MASKAPGPAAAVRKRKSRWWDGYFPPVDPEVKAQALADPGPTWRQYFYRDFLRWWGVLGFLVVDALIVASFANPLDPLAIAFALAPAFYLEYLVYAYFWRSPNLEKESRRGPFRPTWYRPFRYGIWTEDYEEWRAGHDPGAPRGPDPDEFL